MHPPDFVSDSNSWKGSASADLGKRVAVLSFSPIARDQRVLRQVALLRELGHSPFVIGYADDPDDGADHALWRTPRPTPGHRLSTFVRQMPAHTGIAAASAGFWLARRNRWALARLRRCAADVVIANDWPALVVGARYKQERGCRLHYDAHEFAVCEFDESMWWRLVHKPIAVQLERAAIRSADSVSTVGPSLALELQQRYSLPALPYVVRNLPEFGFEPVPETSASWPMRILYHGNVVPHRGVEPLLASMPMWTTPHQLLVRGDGTPAYLTNLRQQVATLGLQDRVAFEPAVSPKNVIAAAAATADCGVFFPPLTTIQRRYTLPNKLFEYIAAGLAVCVSAAPDMQEIVERYGLGVVAPGNRPAEIAAAINAISPEDVIRFRTNARAASTELNWNQEKRMLQSAFAALLR